MSLIPNIAAIGFIIYAIDWVIDRIGDRMPTIWIYMSCKQQLTMVLSLGEYKIMGSFL